MSTSILMVELQTFKYSGPNNVVPGLFREKQKRKCRDQRPSSRVHKEVFADIFSCPACIRRRKQGIETFNNQSMLTDRIFQGHRDLVVGSDSPETALEDSPEIGISECDADAKRYFTESGRYNHQVC